VSDPVAFALHERAAFAALFGGLFDDAAIFPPGNLPLPDAVAAHRTYRDNPLVGPFVCSLARLAELDALLDHPLDVAVVIPAGLFELPPLRHVRIVSVERRADAVGDSPDVPTYVELPTLPATARDLAGIGRVKFRTGGLHAAAFPSEAALAAAISAAVAAGAPFKCTAGLHRAVRHTGADGFEHHGFLNVLLATHAALSGGDGAATLAERDGALLAARLRALPDAALARTRESFRSFGTCSIAEPVTDLHALGLAR
jgi:hypothetical protein